MKERKLGTLHSFKIENKVLLSIADKWCQFFNCENPEFEVVIDKDGRYTLRGPVVHQNPPKSDPTAEQEDITNA